MIKLRTKRLEQCAQLVARGVTYTEAYRRAGFKDHHNNTYRLKIHPQFQARVAEIEAELRAQNEAANAIVIAKKAWDREFFLDRVLAVAELCDGRRTIKVKVLPEDSTEPVEVEVNKLNPAVALKAYEALGRETFNMFIEKREVKQEVTYKDERELEREIDAIFSEATGDDRGSESVLQQDSETRH